MARRSRLWNRATGECTRVLADPELDLARDRRVDAAADTALPREERYGYAPPQEARHRGCRDIDPTHEDRRIEGVVWGSAG